jgi:hypothetical protein
VRDTQRLCDTLGVVSKVRGPYRPSGADSPSVSWRLDMNSFQAGQAMGVSLATKVFAPGSLTPRSVCLDWLNSYPKFTSSSHRTLASRVRNGGSVGVFSFRSMLENAGENPLDWDLLALLRW